MLNADNVLLFILFHIKQLRERDGAPKIVTADIEIWQRALYALSRRCNSTLLLTFDFRRVGLLFQSRSLELAFGRLVNMGAISEVATAYERYETSDFILRDELSTAIQVTRVDSTTNRLACYVSDVITDPSLSTDYQAMLDETRELADQLLPMLDKRVDEKITIHSKQEAKTNE